MLRKCVASEPPLRTVDLDVLRDDEGEDPIGRSFGRIYYGDTS
jgi:hypothetical protein